MIAENAVYQMDALDLLRALPDASVDMIFTDPPYGHRNNDAGDLIHRREAALGGTLQAPRANTRPWRLLLLLRRRRRRA